MKIRFIDKKKSFINIFENTINIKSKYIFIKIKRQNAINLIFNLLNDK